MALSQSDIEELKAAVPPHMRPAADAGTSLPDSFASVSGVNATDRLLGSVSDPATQTALVEIARQLEAGQIETASVILPTNQRNAREDAEKRKADQRRNDALLITMLDRARDWSRRLGERIETMERGFEAEMGDAWREQIANEIMEPDEIPQRRDGESMEAYRERLEDVLVEKMIDPATGEIRPEYQNDPRLRRYAEWAQAEYQKREVDAYIARRSDPSLSPAQQEAEDRDFAGRATAVQLREATIDLSAEGVSPTVRDKLDERRETASSQASSEALAFGI